MTNPDETSTGEFLWLRGTRFKALTNYSSGKYSSRNFNDQAQVTCVPVSGINGYTFD